MVGNAIWIKIKIPVKLFFFNELYGFWCRIKAIYCAIEILDEAFVKRDILSNSEGVYNAIFVKLFGYYKKSSVLVSIPLGFAIYLRFIMSFIYLRKWS